MHKDTVALHGFGKMFKHHYNLQLENVNKIRSYIIKRGGIVETPGYSVIRPGIWCLVLVKSVLVMFF